MSILNLLSSQIGDRSEEANRHVVDQCLIDPSLINELAEGLESKKDALIGDCAEVMTLISETHPDLIVSQIPLLIRTLSNKATRPRWEAMHALANVVEMAPDQMLPALEQIHDLLKNDKSIIVRDYAAKAAGNLSKVGPDFANKAYPLLKSALTVHEGRHAHHAMQGLECVVSWLPEFHNELRILIEPLTNHKKKVIQKSAKSLLAVLDSE